ncbi:MAG: helix-turn-helix transcriptional regulator [Kurthia gibsonii]|uniref:Helix-turn-helix transcriptional regulator n=1 Tax=Kurthia gibsonii TaxID=33946 RepID=A0ABU9LGZ3_9BACL|nr:helix-turn-helix transcriptional regulator [Kurthia gibsonii]MEB6111944.1 helix-turn-helix transcriptional regulator [Kurthia gibsonii]MEB7771535.1 helix-turn-helix transcriptional regulator [Kurthia gibsonii]
MKNHVRDLRMQYDLSQDALAEKVGVSRQTIISLEKGKYNPSIMLAFKLARVFRCQIEDLFIYEEENS